MKTVLACTLLGLTLCFSNPISAAANPRRSSTIRFSTPNAQGGYTGGRRTTITRPNDTSIIRQRGYQTDGQGNVIYGGSATGTTPVGAPIHRTTTGTGSYSPETGYTGQSTTTINGKTYNSTTENGTTTIIGPNGEVRIRTRIR